MTLRITEHGLEKRVANWVGGKGRFTFHNDPATTPGIPDRYVGIGTWVEFKNERSFTKTRKALDRQRTFMNMLDTAGDECYVCCLVGDLLYFEPWKVWKKREGGDSLTERRGYLTGSPFTVDTVEDIDLACEQVFATWRKS